MNDPRHRNPYNPDASGLNKAEGARMRKITDEQSRARRNVDIERRAVQRQRDLAAGCNCAEVPHISDPATHACPVHDEDSP